MIPGLGLGKDTRIVFFLCFFVIEFLSFENLIKKVYQYIACEQALLCEFREIFCSPALLLLASILTPLKVEKFKNQQPAYRLTFPRLTRTSVSASKPVYIWGVSQLLIYLDILMQFFLIIYPHQLKQPHSQVLSPTVVG